MAAVAAEPGAAAAAPTTTAGDGLEYEAEPGEHGAGGESHSKRDFVPETDLCHRQRHQQAPDAADAVEECGQVQMEIMRRRRRPELQAAGKAQPEDGHAAASGAWSRVASRDELALTDYKRTDVNAAADERLKEARSDAASQPGPHESEPNFSSVSISVCNSQPSVDFLYFPTIHPETLGTETETGTEASLTLSQPVLEFHREPESTCPNEIATDSLGTNSEPGSVPVASESEPEPRDRPPESMCHNDMGIDGLETNSEPEPAPTVTSDSNPHDRPPEPTPPSDFETNSEPVPVASDSEPHDPPPDSTYPSDLVTNSEPIPVTSESEPHNPPSESPPSSLEEETSLGESVGQSCMSDFSNTSSKDSAELPAESEPEDVDRHPVLPFKTDPSQAEAKTGPEPESESGSQSGFEFEAKPQVSCPETTVCCPQPVAMGGLVPGSEVRVSLDHIIDDALVVSFRLGEKIFSGVLMDLSKRFGPYGIPITVFPKREYKDKPESMQLKTEAFQSETEKGEGHGDGAPPKETAPEPQPHPWTSKPPPLFQEGAPYPPPLFIRDTYNQSLPQPLPRKIKRPKRRLYREEPTSILNAIKLRPRQVLCDKCKGAVAQGDRRDTRRGPVSDCRNDDAKRRRNSNDAVAGKRPRSEDRSRNVDAKRHATAIRVTHSASLSHGHAKGATGHRVAKGVQPAAPSSANSSARVGLGAKKVLQSKNVEHSKAREVLKKAQRRQRETVAASNNNNNNNNPKATTRAAALQEAHQKVHFTRRLQQISGGGAGAAGGGGTAASNPLPPRMRIKPQRYRNEENDSSLCKPPCLEKVPGGGRLALPKLAAARCSAARSSSSSSSASSSSSFSCSAAAATAAAAAAESQGSERALKPALSQTQIQIQQPQPHSDPDPRHPEPEEREGRGSGGVGKAGNLVVYMTLNSSQPDSSSTSMCSVDSADDLKSSNSECSSTETLDFPPPGDFRSAPGPSSVSVSASASVSAFAPASASVAKEEKKRGKSLKAAVFSKNVSKCVALDGRTICVGDIVWAKILGFPWWPARILAITVSRKDNGLLVRQEARVSWFGSPTTSFLAVTQLAPFLENFQLRFDKKRKGLYRKAITEAAKAAKQLTPEVRALLTQFET